MRPRYIGDPLFNDATNFDYSLKVGSAAINKGFNLGVDRIRLLQACTTVARPTSAGLKPPSSGSVSGTMGSERGDATRDRSRSRSASFVLEEFRVDAAGAVVFEFGDDGGHAAEFDFFDDAFAELLVADDRAGANLNAFADLAVVRLAFDDARADGGARRRAGLGMGVA